MADSRSRPVPGRAAKHNAGVVLPASVPLVPPALLVPLWFVALALPNLIYSGVSFADTLHIMKWTVTGLPIAAALLVAGWRLFRYGRDRIDFGIDLFGALWAALLAYCVAQVAWVRISSFTTLAHELLCFAAVWAFYLLTVAVFPNGAIRPLLWLANINGALNVLFAELQIRNLNDLAFLREVPLLGGLADLSSLILPTPYNYIGNTAQQNMFGLWMAVCVMSSVYLFIAYAVRPDGRRRHPAATALNLLLMAVNIWGLWNSTSRSGILSLFVGLFVLGLVVLVHFGRDYAKRLGLVILLFAAVLGGAMLLNRARAVELVAKTVDMVQDAGSVGGRRGIWTTSWTMFRQHPQGVGVGQYKWHYLEAQREAFRTHDYNWQYTHWAHNEFLQWFCETGVVGGVLLLLMFGLWFFAFFGKVFRRDRLSPEVIWGCSLVALISFNALWTRPFHRIENILWLALAFAVTNREVLTGRLGWRATFSSGFTRLIGVLFMAGSLAGAVYLGSGIQGNLLLRQALSTRSASLQRGLLERSARHPMVRQDALKNLGYHYLQVGEQTNDVQTMGRGFNILWQHFRREPHSEEMGVLLQWAQRFQQVEILKELVSFLKPGTYRLEVRPGVQDSNGNVVDALVMVPVQSSGGMQVVSEAVPSSEPRLPDSAGEPASR
ncbi:O-antigen ligase family protein [Fretibacterium sp. OH1220_COT-178]|uniref:O-antigen ligase family protein n=1 Tax=Fretibacterium sp. OH1220_COT-178 TaxID=2491047 RepID=UPI000F5F6761|nr:O-antigen ligase family protein [Fretibacterium sp. OH1220_COT-178]RRD63693.1 O-antigen ligase family protein [Fretibacterium sp. OH1220_COT-178]